MPNDRSLHVLKAIVEDYVATREPVGSKRIVERHDFGVSAATIRNDMALLEEEELIVAPHTSAGRIPTDKGYRVFVDSIDRISGLSDAQRRAISTFLDSSSDLDEVLDRAVRLLSQFTQHLALIQYPALSHSRIRHVELVHERDETVLLIVITNAGRVYQHEIAVDATTSDEAVIRLRNVINAHLAGRPLSAAARHRAELLADLETSDRAVAEAVLDTLESAGGDARAEKLVVAGTANLVRRGGEMSGSAYQIIEAIEEQVALIRLMSEMEAPAQGVSVRIGRENEAPGLSDVAVVAGDYGAGDDESSKLAIIGPTRMEYSRNMAAVRAVATYLSRILAS